MRIEANNKRQLKLDKKLGSMNDEIERVAIGLYLEQYIGHGLDLHVEPYVGALNHNINKWKFLGSKRLYLYAYINTKRN